MRTLYISFLLVILGFAACTKEVLTSPSDEKNPNYGITTITASLECNTRTALEGNDAGGYKVVWSDGDQITAIDANEQPYKLTLAEGAGTTSGVFESSVPMPDGDYRLFYCTEGDALDRIQTYNGEGVVSNAPMYTTVAVKSGNASPATFMNLCGLVRLTLKGEGDIGKITISSDEAMSGHVIISEDGRVIFNKNYHKDVSLSLGEGVELSSEGTTFYIALPPNEYHDVSITVTDTDGYECTRTLKSGKTLDVTRSLITPVGLTVTFLRPISWDSPVGTVGMLDGREAMVVEYGYNKDKLAVATMNVGANTYTETGPFYTWMEAIKAQNRGDFGPGWYMPSNSEVMTRPADCDIVKEGKLALVKITESAVLKFPLGGFYNSETRRWELIDEQSVTWSSEPESFVTVQKLDIASLLVYEQVWASGLSCLDDKLNIRTFHKLPITRKTPVGKVGYLDGKEAMVVELDVNGEKKKVAVALRNEGATNISIFLKISNTQYLDCFGSFLTYTQAQSKCTDGWYIPTIEEWQSLMSSAQIVNDKLLYEGTFGAKDQHRAIVVNVNGNSLILPAGGLSVDSNQKGWQCYYWSSTADGSKMKCLWSRENIGTLSSDKTLTYSTRLFHAIP